MKNFARLILRSGRRGGGRGARRSLRAAPLVEDLRPVRACFSGLNMVYEAVGKHVSLLGYCLESLIIDNATRGQCIRCLRGIEVNETTPDMQVMKDVCIGGPGNYLGHDQTISLMQTGYFYLEIGDRSSPKEWEELNNPSLLEIAIKRKQEILDNFHPTHQSAELDADLRGKFRILLDA